MRDPGTAVRPQETCIPPHHRPRPAGAQNEKGEIVSVLPERTATASQAWDGHSLPEQGGGTLVVRGRGTARTALALRTPFSERRWASPKSETSALGKQHQEKLFVTHGSNEGRVSSSHKELQQLSKKTNGPTGRRLSQTPRRRKPTAGPRAPGKVLSHRQQRLGETPKADGQTCPSPSF